MSRHYDHVLSFAISHPWAVLPEMLSIIAGILAHRIAGVELDQAQIQAALVDRKNLPQPRVGSVAVLPIYGVLAPRMNMFSRMSGGTSYEQLTTQLRDAVNDKTVRTIVFDVNSPGGSVAGNAEFAAEVMKARAKKPVIAVAQYTMGSAAYQLSAAATEIVASPSAHVGGIGTYGIHDDLSAQLEKLGVKRTFISAGEGKVDGNDSEPLSESGQARIQALVNQAYDQFVATVVNGRGKGMTADRVTKDWKAHVYGAAEAQALGMIDRVATLDDTLLRVLTDSPDAADHRAAQTVFSLPAPDTLQEPARATSQDRSSDRALRNVLEGLLIELDT
jgi:signal peptide peptidase SppA